MLVIYMLHSEQKKIEMKKRNTKRKQIQTKKKIDKKEKRTNKNKISFFHLKIIGIRMRFHWNPQSLNIHALFKQ